MLPQAGSAAERTFGCRTWFLPKGQKLSSTCINASQLIQSCIFLFYNMHTQAYKLLGASNYPKPHLQHIKHKYPTYIAHKHTFNQKLNINLHMHFYPKKLHKTYLKHERNYGSTLTSCRTRGKTIQLGDGRDPLFGLQVSKTCSFCSNLFKST